MSPPPSTARPHWARRRCMEEERRGTRREHGEWAAGDASVDPSSFLQFCETVRVVWSCFRVIWTRFSEISCFRSPRARDSSLAHIGGWTHYQNTSGMHGNTAYPKFLHLTLKDKLSKSYQKNFQVPGLNTKISAPRDSSNLRCGTGTLATVGSAVIMDTVIYADFGIFQDVVHKLCGQIAQGVWKF